MKRVLFLPLFQMDSGHHRTANALMEAFQSENSNVLCEKVDFLSYTNQHLEKIISGFYLKCITESPSSYSKIYSSFFQKNTSMMHSLYEALFLEKMEQLIQLKKPDLIICTHSFSSFLVNKLKSYGVCTAPVINVYTDFFINGLWGKKNIDMHLVPSKDVKENLIEEGVDKENIKISGILTNDKFKRKKIIPKDDSLLHVLVAGGSLGLGENLDDLFTASESRNIQYKVLCGHNKKLFNAIREMDSKNVKPISYISATEQMNQLYQWADALITKPGGITIGEAIKKRLPIFIHSVLPGQEERNLAYLDEKRIICKLNTKLPLDQQIISVLMDPKTQFLMKKARYQYIKDIELKSCADIVRYLQETYIQDSGNMQMKFIDEVFSELFRSL